MVILTSIIDTKTRLGALLRVLYLKREVKGQFSQMTSKSINTFSLLIGHAPSQNIRKLSVLDINTCYEFLSI